MSADVAARLRSLAQDHSAGKLSLDAYRKLRAPLLDSLSLPGAGAVDEGVTQPRIVGRAAGAAPVERPAAAQQPTPPRAAARWTIPIVIVVLLAAGAALWSVLRTTPNEQASIETVEQRSPVHHVIEPFMQQGDWSDVRVAALNVSLLELGQRQIAAAASEPWFQRFVDDLRKRLKEQQALAHAPLTARSSPLAALASTVGLDLDSPDSAIRIMAAAPVGSAAISTAPASQDATPTAQASPPSPRDQKAANANASVASAVSKSSTTRPASEIVAATRSTCRIALIGSRRPFCQDTLSSGESGPELALIPAGAFNRRGAGGVEAVAIHEPFAMSVYEVSQAEFSRYCDDAGVACAEQPWAGDDFPVVNVSWADASAYADWLSRMTGHRYGLPSEAQWEYATGGGEQRLEATDAAVSPTDAHYSMLTRQTAPARRSQRFNHNAFRLMHTLGNVREWVADAWVEDSSTQGAAAQVALHPMRVVRGGSWIDPAAKVRLSSREPLAGETRDAFTGFRVVRELP